MFRSQVRDIAEDTNRTVSDIKSHTRRYEDNISKKMADIRMSPWRGEELDAEYTSSQEARARITGLERQLHDITRASMAYRSVKCWKSDGGETGQRPENKISSLSDLISRKLEYRMVESGLFTFFSRLGQAYIWTKTKSFYQSCTPVL